LALVATGVLRFPVEVIEFLIPLTIVAAGMENLRRPATRPSGALRPALAGAFGLVHGAGFASALAGLLDAGLVEALLGFNLGVEIAQAGVLGTIALAFSALDWMMARTWSRPAPALAVVSPRARFTSVGVVAAGLVLAWQRTPW
jgi:hypothetical protein